MFLESVCVYVSVCTGHLFFSCIRRGCQADGLHRCLHHVCVRMSMCKYFCVCVCVFVSVCLSPWGRQGGQVQATSPCL